MDRERTQTTVEGEAKAGDTPLTRHFRNLFRIEQPDRSGLHGWFRSFVDELEDKRSNFMDTIGKFGEELASEVSQLKIDIHNILEESRGRAKTEADTVLEDLSKRLKNHASDLEKKFITMSEEGAREECSTVVVEMKERGAKITSGFESLGRQRISEVNNAMEKELEKIENILTKEAEAIQQNFRVKAATLLEKFETQLRDSMKKLVSQVDAKLKEDATNKGRKITEELQIELEAKREVWRRQLDGESKILNGIVEEAIGKLKEEGQTHVDTAVSRLEKEVSDSEESLRVVIHSKMEEKREELDKRVNEAFHELNNEILTTRDQLAHRLLEQKTILDEMEAATLSKVEGFKRQLEEGLCDVRVKATKTISICGSAAAEEDKRTKNLLGKIDELESKRISITKKLDEIGQKLKDTEGNIEDQFKSKELQNKIDSLTSKVTEGLNTIDKEVQVAEDYVTNVNNRIEELRSKVAKTFSEYEAKISTVKKELDSTLGEEKRKALQAAEEEIAAETSKLVESYQEELKKIASETRGKIGRTKMDMAAHSKDVVGSSQKIGRVGYTPKTELPCPHCGMKLTWIPAYGRFYCYSCRRYAPRNYEAAEVDTKREKSKAETDLEQWYESLMRGTSESSSQTTEGQE